MKYLVQFQDLRYPEFYIDADSEEEAREKAEAIDVRSAQADYVDFTEVTIFDVQEQED